MTAEVPGAPTTTEPSATPPGPAGRRLAGSALFVAMGIGTYALAGFLYLALVGHTLGDHAAPVLVAWSVLNAVCFGLYSGLEQHISRRVRLGGRHREQALRQARTFMGVSVAVVAVVVVTFAGPIGRAFFFGGTDVVRVLGAAFAAHALAYYFRGLFGGEARFGRYAAQLVTDGVLRMVGAGALALTGVTAPTAWVGLLVATPLLAVLVTVSRRPAPVDTNADAADQRGRLTTAVLTTLSSQVMVNLASVIIPLLAAAPIVTGYSYAVVITRVPLLAFAAIAAVGLPRLASHVAGDDRGGYVGDVRQLAVLTLGLALLGAVPAVVLGPWAMRVLFGVTYTVSPWLWVGLAVSCTLLMLASLAAQALLALGRDKTVALGWTAGLVTHSLLALAPGDPATVVTTAMACGALVALVALAASLRYRVRRWAVTGVAPVGEGDSAGRIEP